MSAIAARPSSNRAPGTIAEALVAQLRPLQPGTKPHLGEIRRAIAGELGECSMAGLSAAIQHLRFAGKIQWDRLELSPSMRVVGDAAAGGGPDDEAEDYPGQVNDIEHAPEPHARTAPSSPPRDASAQGHPEALAKSTAEPGLRPPPPPALIEPGAEETAAPVRTPGADPTNRAVPEGGGPPTRIGPPPSTLHKAGVHAAATRAGSKPVPAPRHESEVAKAARDEANEAGQRRRSARSTATVSRPLAIERVPPEVKRFGIPDVTFSEAVGTMLSDDPQAIVRAVSRKHPAMWRRVIMLGRVRGKSPMETLYAALDAGLDQLEPKQQEARDAA